MRIVRFVSRERVLFIWREQILYIVRIVRFVSRERVLFIGTQFSILYTSVYASQGRVSE